MREAPNITVKPLTDITAKQAQAVRVNALAFVFKCWQEKQMAAGRLPSPDDPDGPKTKEESADASSLPQ